MAEIVLEFVSVVFEYVEALVLDFPARSAAGDNLGDIVLETGRAVTAMEYLTLPLASRISKPIQLSSIASLPSRRGTASIQR